VPTYQYECTKCSNNFEIVRSINENSDVFCKSCNVIAKRIYSSFGIVFNGSGFYSTDNRGK
jgi:putative FmdB family regulatory protein